MNIFVLSECPVDSAVQQCDKHVVKMIVESAQMLSTAHRMVDGKQTTVLSSSGRRIKMWKLDDPYLDNLLYKSVHTGHPSTVWTTESDQNYQWHYRHFVALCDEYEYRYGKVHSTRTKLEEALAQTPNNIKRTESITPFKLAMQQFPACIVEGDAVQSYRNFYQTKQDRFNMAWTKRPIPSWFEVRV
jgi:hypothetical protein